MFIHSHKTLSCVKGMTGRKHSVFLSEDMSDLALSIAAYLCVHDRYLCGSGFLQIVASLVAQSTIALSPF